MGGFCDGGPDRAALSSVLLVSGPAALVANPYVVTRKTPFFEGLAPLAQAAWLRWSEGVPATIVWIFAGGLVAGLIFHQKISTIRISMTLVLWGWSFGFAWTRNILGYPRVWNYLLLAAVMTACAGISIPIRWLGGFSQTRQVVLAGIVSTMLAVVVGVSLMRSGLLFRNNETGAMIDTVQVVEFLRSTLRAGDSLVVKSVPEPIIEYELLHRDRRLFRSLVAEESANRVIVVLPKPEVASGAYPTNERLAKLAAEDAVEASAASAEMDLSAFAPPQLLGKFVSVTVYSFERKQLEK